MKDFHDYLVINCTLPNGGIFQRETFRVTNAVRNHLRVCAAMRAITFPPTVIMNALVITAILKSRVLCTKSNILFISLSLSDLLIGLIPKPISALFLYWQSTGVTNCYLGYIIFLSAAPLSNIQVASVAGIAFEKYFALFKTYTHERLITSTGIIRFLLAIWAVVFILFIASFMAENIAVGGLITAPIFMANFCWNVFVYVKIQAYVRGLKKRIENENNPVGYVEDSDKHAQEFSAKSSEFPRGLSPADDTNCRSSTKLFTEATKIHVYSPTEMHPQASTSKCTKPLSLQATNASDNRSCLNNSSPVDLQESPNRHNVVLISTPRDAFKGNDRNHKIKHFQTKNKILPPDQCPNISPGCPTPPENHVKCIKAESPQSLALYSLQMSAINANGRSEGCCNNLVCCPIARFSSRIRCILGITKKPIRKKAANNGNGRLAVFTVSIIGALLITYLPCIVWKSLRTFGGTDAITLLVYEYYSFTILGLNALLNPLICLVQCPQIRREVLKLILRRPETI